MYNVKLSVIALLELVWQVSGPYQKTSIGGKNVKLELLEKKIGEKFGDIGLSKEFLDLIKKA